MKKAAVSEILYYLKNILKDFENIESYLNKEVKLMGWVNEKRIFKNVGFFILKLSNEYKIQIVTKDKDKLEDIKKIKRDSIVYIEGILKEREKPNFNEKLGKYEINLKKLILINESKDLPIDYRGFTNISEFIKLKYRYLILRNEKYYRNLKFRAQLMNLMRNFLIDHGFIEVETPALTKSVPEGSRDFLVISRLYPGKFYALAQSPQLYKQLLMISGFHRYFQFVKVFRDEDPREDRQPEFTQLDIEMAYVSEEDIRRFIEKLIKYTLNEILGVKIKTPFLELDYKDAVEKYGSDKPDLRIPYEFKKYDEYYILEFDDKHINEIKKIVRKVSKEYKEKIDINYLKDEIKKEFGIESFVISKNPFALGKIRDFIGKLEGYKDIKEYKFLWIVNFPYFEFEDGKYYPSHHPFTLPKNIELLDEKPEKVLGTNFDLVNNGFEIAGGSLRIHDRSLQEKIFKLMGMEKEEYLERYGWFLEALDYGCPPHGGIAFGFDRFVATLLYIEDIKEVIAFPKSLDWKDPLTNAPAKVPKEYLDEVKNCCENIK